MLLVRLYENDRGGPVRLDGESSNRGVRLTCEVGVLEFQESDARCPFTLDELAVELECVLACEAAALCVIVADPPLGSSLVGCGLCSLFCDFPASMAVRITLSRLAIVARQQRVPDVDES